MQIHTVAVVALVFALTPLASAAGPAEQGSLETTSFSYAPPEAFVGDLALRFQFDWGQDNGCRILFGMSGLIGDEPLYGMVASDRGASFGFYHDDAVRVRSNGEAFNVESAQTGDTWGFGIFQFLTLSGTETFTIAGSDLQTLYSDSGGSFQNLFFNVSCNDPFVTGPLAGGNDVVTFTENLGNGQAVGIYTPTQETGVFVGDGASATFDTPEAALVLRSFVGDGAGMGSAQVTTPEGTEQIPFQDALDVDRHGTGGAYGISLTQAASGVSTTMYGALVGLETVDAVEDLARFTS